MKYINGVLASANNLKELYYIIKIKMESDPLSYFFGILKYITNNNNIINNNNNYKNNNNIINEPIIKAFGQCIRSMLRKEEYTEISLIISCKNIISELIKLLKIFEIISRNIEMDYTKLVIFQIIILIINSE